MHIKITKPKIFESIPIFFILLLALVLRIQQWFHFLGHDEIFTMQWIWQFHQDPFPIHHYAPFFLYVNFILSFVYKAVLSFLGVINFDASFFTSDFGFIFTLKAARILTAFFGVLMVYFVYRIGRRFLSREAALAGALILAVSRPLVIDSHNFKTDVFVALLLTIVLYFSIQHVKTGEPKAILLTAFFLGLSVAAKYNAAFMAPVVVISLFLVRGSLKDKFLKKKIVFVFLGTLGGFALGAPNWIVHPIENFKIAFTYLKKLSAHLNWYDPLPSSYILYSKNILESFGIILVVLLLIGLIWPFVKKDRIGILISLYVLVYFLFIGSANYLNHRALLPIFSGIALLIGKVLFCDLKPALQKIPKLRSFFSPLIWVVVVVIASQHFLVNLKSFNLLKTISSHPVQEYDGLGLPDYSWFFMKNHVDENFSFFREMWTPPVAGYRGSAFAMDISKSDLKRFRGPEAFHFLITSYRTNYILAQTKNQVVKRAVKKRLAGYSPFYRVFRPRIFTWNDDITFWYRRPGYIKTYKRADPSIKLPRIFYHGDKNPTIYLPLQFYEKNPNFGLVKNRHYRKRFFSNKEISEIRFLLLNPEIRTIVKIKINNAEKNLCLQNNAKINPILIQNISPDVYKGMPIRRLQEATLDERAKNTYHYLYELEIEANHSQPCYFVFFPSFKGEKNAAGKKFIFREKAKEEIPALFSPDPYPFWMERFYKQTGIDLALLQFVNKKILYKNPRLSVKDFAVNCFPLETGDYFIKITGSKMLEEYPVSDQATIQLEMISDEESKTMTVKLNEDFFNNQKSISIKASGNINFVKMKSQGCRRGNIIIKEITLVPDYKTYINNNFVIKNDE